MAKKQLDTFSPEMLNQTVEMLSGDSFYMLDHVLSISFLNAVYHFVDYLATCDMLDGLDPQAVKESTESLYQVIFKSESIPNSVALCFDEFPLWNAN